jgi:hypothetical protein
MHASEVADPRMVRVVMAASTRKATSSYVRRSILRDEGTPTQYAVQQQRHHHLRMVWRIAAQLAFVVRVDRPQIELRDDIHDEARQVVFR